MRGTNLKPENVSEVERRFYSERDLAAALGVSVKTCQGWRFRSQGPPWRRLCGTVRYDVRELEAWVRAQPGSEGSLPAGVEEVK
jgi:hypothetical protein